MFGVTFNDDVISKNGESNTCDDGSIRIILIGVVNIALFTDNTYLHVYIWSAD